MDYMLPTACDIPAMQIIHQHSPSPLNPLGVKGVGEGGAIAPPAAIANAVCRRAASVQGRVQPDANQAPAHRAGCSIGVTRPLTLRGLPVSGARGLAGPGDPKPVPLAADRRREPEACRRAQIPWLAGPGAAAQDATIAVAGRPGRAVRRSAFVAVVVAILDPLPGIAVHVVEAPGIGLESSTGIACCRNSPVGSSVYFCEPS